MPNQPSRHDLPGSLRWILEEGAGRLRVEEEHDADRLVIRSELPGIDPSKDVDLSVEHGVLHIRAERKIDPKLSGKAHLRSEFAYGSFVRDVPLPRGVKRQDITATYRDGILEVIVPLPKEDGDQSGTIPITKSA